MTLAEQEADPSSVDAWDRLVSMCFSQVFAVNASTLRSDALRALRDKAVGTAMRRDNAVAMFHEPSWRGIPLSSVEALEAPLERRRRDRVVAITMTTTAENTF